MHYRILDSQYGKDNAGKNGYMRQLQMFQKVEYGGGPIFKVVLTQKSPKKKPKNGSLNRNLLKFLNWYGIFILTQEDFALKSKL